MFEEFLGLPMHPLLVHAAVILVPMLAAAVLAYGLVPFTRRHITWIVVSLAVVAPITAYITKLSGEAFRAREIRKNLVSPQVLDKLTVHKSWADKTAWTAIALGVLTLVLVWAFRRAGQTASAVAATGSSGAYIPGGALGLILVAATSVLAVLATLLIFKTGDTGAHIVWSGF